MKIERSMYNKYITEAFNNNTMDNVNILHCGKIISQEKVNGFHFVINNLSSPVKLRKDTKPYSKLESCTVAPTSVLVDKLVLLKIY